MFVLMQLLGAAFAVVTVRLLYPSLSHPAPEHEGQAHDCTN
jgi:hypothetical protein